MIAVDSFVMGEQQAWTDRAYSGTHAIRMGEGRLRSTLEASP
jgi:hypothetical protein